MARKKQPKPTRTQNLFRELMSGVEAMREHRGGRLTLRTDVAKPVTLISVNAGFTRATRAIDPNP
jgi:hypothetical protein